MTTDDFVKYMTMAKGEFFSRFHLPVVNIQVYEETDEFITFELEGATETGYRHEVARVVIKKRERW